MQVLEAYTGLVQGLKTEGCSGAADARASLIPHIETAIDFVKKFMAS